MRSRLPGHLAWPALVAVLTVGHVLLMTAFHPDFYLRGDTDAQFAPTWFHLGEMVRAGQWPPLLDRDAWVGGNYAAEALFGVYNPLNLLIWFFVSASGDLAVAVVTVKAAALVGLALGTYAVARDHGAERWAAAVVATALPVSGYTTYWDAGSWAGGLIAFAYAPWVWWSFRRVLQRRLNPLWAFLLGSLAVTQGNPYGTLGVVVIGAAVLVEAAVARDGRGAGRLVLLGLCVAAWLPLVYAPLLATSDLAFRAGGLLFSNNGKMRPELGDLLLLSSPTFTPDVRAIRGPMTVPATYFAWFLVPLLPWLRFGDLRGRARTLLVPLVVAGVYLVLTLSPSKLWLFRWPLRQVEYCYLGLAVVVAVVLGFGLARDHARRRLAGTAGLVLLTGWLTWAQDPPWTMVSVGGPLLLVVLTAALLVLHLRGLTATWLAVLLLAGGTGVLATQAVVFGENSGSRLWHFPHDVSTLRADFAERDGRVIQFADLAGRQKEQKDARLRASWRSFLAGSMYHPAGVDAVNNYTGLGYLPFNRRLCMAYDGLTRPCGYRQLLQPVAPSGVPMVDLMKVETIVVQASLTRGVAPPTGWSESREGEAVVLRRQQPLPWPGSELSNVGEGFSVASATTTGPYGERVDGIDAPDGGPLTFASLAWPGWQARLDGRPVPVRADEVGLVTVTVPAGTSDGTLSLEWSPPGLRIGLAAAAVGTLGGLALGLLPLVRGRRRRRPAQAAY